jgi:hypothetical protein
MLENLIQLVKENAGAAIINNPAIPNEHNDAACETAATSIFDNLKGIIGNGGLESITSLFQSGGNAASHPVVKDISSNVAGDLMKKFGLDKGTAGNIVSQLLPTVMSKLVHKTNDPSDNSFNLQNIIGSLTGGQGAGGILNSIKGLFGN